MHILSRAPAGAALRAEVHSPTPLWGVILSNSSASGNIPWTVAQGHILEFLLQMGWVWPWGSSQPQPVLSQAHIRFKPTLSQQKSPGQEDTVLNGNFIIRYDVNRTLSGGSIQVCGLQARIGATRKSIHTQGLELTCSRRKGKVTAPTHQCEPVAAQTKNKQFCYVSLKQFSFGGTEVSSLLKRCLAGFPLLPWLAGGSQFSLMSNGSSFFHASFWLHCAFPLLF